MRIRITEGACAADTMFRACLAVTELAGRIVDMDMTDNGPPSPGPRSVGITALVQLRDGRVVPVIANCHIVRTDDGWTDGLCDFYGEVGHEKLIRFLYDMSTADAAPVVHEGSACR